MNKKILRLPVEFEFSAQISPVISKYVTRVMYENDNRNGSYFKREVIDAMTKTLGGIPVVGQYSETDNDFLAHGDLVISTDAETGETTFETVGTDSYGYTDRVNPVFYWAKHEDEDGVVRDYLHVEVFLWTQRYPELEIIKEGKSNISMEITATGDFEEIDGMEYFVPNEDTYFTGLCILGQNVEPCFEGAAIIPYFSLQSEEKNDREEKFKELELALQQYNFNEETEEFDLEVDNIDEVADPVEFVEETVETVELEAETENKGETEVVTETETETEEAELVEEVIDETPLETVEEEEDNAANTANSEIEETETEVDYAAELESVKLENKELKERIENMQEDFNEKLKVLEEYKNSLKNEEYEELLKNIFALSKEEVTIRSLKFSVANLSNKTVLAKERTETIKENSVVLEDSIENQMSNFSLYQDDGVNDKLEPWQAAVLKKEKELEKD